MQAHCPLPSHPAVAIVAGQPLESSSATDSRLIVVLQLTHNDHEPNHHDGEATKRFLLGLEVATAATSLRQGQFLEVLYRDWFF